MIKILRLKVKCHFYVLNQLFIFEKFQILNGLGNKFGAIDFFDVFNEGIHRIINQSKYH